MATGKRSTIVQTGAQYGSDVVVDLLRALNMEFIALNPGATFRGLHDSLVNYGENRAPEMILCNHEEIAIAIAHGYQRASGRPMVAAVHNIVGLLHASMALYNAWLDRAGMLVLGGTGPMAVEHRRPWIDWIHTGLVQGNAVRDFVKWDDQPTSIPGVVDSLLRGHQLAVAEPGGPVYINLDTDLQEGLLPEPFMLPDVSRYAPPTRLQADPAALAQAAAWLAASERPVVLADYLGKEPEAVRALQQLAEALALPVVDLGNTFNFPTRHPLNLSEAADTLLPEADLVLALGVPDLQQAIATVDRDTRMARPIIADGARIIDISLRHYSVRSWMQDFGRLQPADLTIAASTDLALPALLQLAQQELARTPQRQETLRQRASRLGDQHHAVMMRFDQRAAAAASERPIALPFLAQQVWEVVQGHDWFLGDNSIQGWCRRLWDIKAPYQYLTSRGGAGLGGSLGRAVGAALANRGKNRLCVQFQADGDMLFTPSTLWTAAHHNIPMLVVMYNNRTYYNDEEHQAVVARVRGRPEENKVVGITMDSPPVDFGAMARSFGVYGEGPIERPEDLRPALERALKAVLDGQCALVDVVTQSQRG